jgi:hypothetical protein
MKRIILCEGKTDAILISYFLIRRFHWIYTKDEIIGLPADNDNETLNWYYHPERPGSQLAIWGGGGIDDIPIKLSQVVDRTKNERTEENRFDRIVIFFDRADLDNAQCVDRVREWSNNANLTINNDLGIGQWSNATIDIKSTPPQEHQVEVLPIVLPPDGNGELETFLLNSLSASSDADELLVERARVFIDDIPDEPYLSHRRYRPKACLGSVLSVISPDWVFSRLDERLLLIEWETLEQVANIYGMLEEL